MKNRLLLLSLFVSIQAFSQTSNTGNDRFNLGLMGGWSGSNMAFREKPNVDGKLIGTTIEPGYFAGVSARQQISRRIATRLEAQYHVRGYRFLDNRNRFSFLELTPLFEINVSEQFSIVAGGYWAARLQQRLKAWNETSFKTIDPEVVELTDANDFGAVAGLNYRWKRFFALVRYQHGLNSAVDVEYTFTDGSTTSGRQFNRTVQIGVGYILL
ncbi:MAG: outer membrane beta-barrel protein [Saprospiraceae bacterium]|nr:outer membrane beta-barrel protein [Saprospiraceae bacterium]